MLPQRRLDNRKLGIVRQESKGKGGPDLSEKEMAPTGAMEAKNLSSKTLVEKALSDPRWRVLPFHELYIPRIAKLTWKLCHPTTGYANKIYVL